MSNALRKETPRPETVFRLATDEDKRGVYKLLLEMHEEVGMLEINTLKVARQISKVVNEGMCVVAIVDGQIVGSIGAEIGAPWYSEQSFLSECWTFVSKDFRRSAIAHTLLRDINEIAKSVNMLLVIGVFSPVQAERKAKLFGRIFRPVGGIFVGGKNDVLLR